MAASTESRRELALAPSVAVGIGGVEEVDPVRRVRGAEHLDRLFVGLLSPPAGREGPRAEADFAGTDVGAGKLPVAHRQIGFWRSIQVNRGSAIADNLELLGGGGGEVGHDEIRPRATYAEQ